MVTSDEVNEIIQLSFQYIIAHMDHMLVDFTFQLNHWLYEAFKEKVGDTFMIAIAGADWSKLCRTDETAARRFEEVEGKIKALQHSLRAVNSLVSCG